MKNLTRQNPRQLIVAQELINKVKSKCCGIKGGQIKSGITGKVDFVFAGEDCGWSKIQKINDLNQSKKANIRILNEADLNYLIKKYGI